MLTMLCLIMPVIRENFMFISEISEKYVVLFPLEFCKNLQEDFKCWFVQAFSECWYKWVLYLCPPFFFGVSSFTLWVCLVRRKIFSYFLIFV